MMNRETTAFVFPGQGSQFVGMGKEFAEHDLTKHLFDKANEVLGFDLKGLMLNGPEEELTFTYNTQPALLLAGVAAWTYLCKTTNMETQEMATYVAGHSLGEYVALVAAGVLEFEDALTLVSKRGQFMHAAMPEGEHGAMAAILGLDAHKVRTIVESAGCWVANDNSIGQVVISGSNRDVDEASNVAAEEGAKRVARLNVSAPFHCPLMQSAADKMKEELERVTFSNAQVPVVLNVTGCDETNGEEIRRMLVQQITSEVCWRESIVHMAEQGITNLYEFGAGKVLTGLAKRCDPEKRISCVPLNTPEDIDDLKAATAA